MSEKILKRVCARVKTGIYKSFHYEGYQVNLLRSSREFESQPGSKPVVMISTEAGYEYILLEKFDLHSLKEALNLLITQKVVDS